MASKTFVQRYIDLVAPATDAPDVYHLIMGYFIISMSLGRRVKFPRGVYTVYPNLWVILFGPTTQMRKSTSMEFPLELLADAGLRVALPGSFSIEGLADFMIETPTGYILYDEFMTLMASFKRDFLGGLQSLLTSLWSCPKEHVIRRRPKRMADGSVKNEDTIVTEPFINIISATTVEWFSKAVVESDFQSGFLPRFLMVPAEKAKPYKASPDPVDETERLAVTQMIRDMNKLAGIVTVSPDAQEDYVKAATEIHHAIDKSDPIFARLSAYFERFCILEAVNTSGNIVITKEAVAGARSMILTFIKWDEKVRSWMTVGADDQLIRRVLSLIPEDGSEVSLRDLLRDSHMLKNKLSPVIETLLDMGQITKRSEVPAGGGRPSVRLKRAPYVGDNGTE